MLSKWRLLVALLALGHFVYFIVKPQGKADTRLWEQKSCYFAKNKEMVDLDCRYYQTKNWVFAQPSLTYGEKLSCYPLNTPDGQRLKDVSEYDQSCGAPTLWGSPQNFFDIGWDAYSVWWGRSAVLFFQSQKTTWRGVQHALMDLKFIQSFANKEQWHYPWGVSLIYFQIMKLVDSPNPFLLQCLHVLLWFACAFLFWKLWPKAPLYLWLSFAFVPTSAIFMFRLYAEIWVVFSLLLLLLLLKKRQLLLAVALAVLIPWLKNEAFLHVICILFAFGFEVKNYKDFRQQRWAGAYFISIFGAIFAFKFQNIFKAESFYVSLSERLMSLEGYRIFFLDILRYYADVFFRPALWGALWPVVIFLLYKNRKTVFPAAFALVFLIAVIPVAFLSFPGGFKEVVLTGSGRALWQCLPLAWYLLSLTDSQKEQALGSAKP